MKQRDKEGDRKRDRKSVRDREIERKNRMKDKKGRWDKTVIDSEIKYMYITVNTTFTCTCYLLINKCCTW